MARSYTSLHYHVIFSTRRREPWLARDREDRVWACLGAIAKKNRLTPLAIGGAEDHVHMLLAVPPFVSLSEAVQRIKSGSSDWAKRNFAEPGEFAWQEGFGAFTVSRSQISELEEYIRKQKAHHRVKSFREEYLSFLNRHQVEYDEHRLWD